MKVVHYSPIVYLERMRTRELTHNQADSLESVTVLGWNPDQQTTRIVDLHHRRNNLKVLLLPGPGLEIIPNAGPYPWLPSFVTTMKRLNPDIVHLHSHLNIQALQIVKAARAMGSSTVVTVHGVSAKISPFVDFAQRTYLKTIGKQLFTLADGIICLTGSDAQELIQIGVQSNKIHVISNGVNEDFFNYCAEDDGQTVVWHGRFVPQKGLHYFVKTARMINGSLPNVRFRMLGSGPQFDEIQRMVESAGLKDRFEFLGKIPWDEVPRAISSASLYMLPSLREGMPWSILEAMSCGKPVVAFSIPGVVDLVEVDGTGYLTDSGDVKMLAKHAIHLLENTSLRGSFGLRARRIVEEKYTWAKIAARTIKLYRRVS